jgi:transposase
MWIHVFILILHLVFSDKSRAAGSIGKYGVSGVDTVEAAWTAIRHDPALLLVYEEWKLRMTGKRAIVKIARKLLSRVRHVWINNSPYVKGIVK